MTKKEFVRSDAHKKSRISKGWRKPKGIQNKKRLNRKNHGKNVVPGYGSPISEKGKHKSGLAIANVSQISELKDINPKTTGIIISKTGKKTKMEIITEAEKLKITVLNLDISKYKESVKKFLEDRKKTVDEKKKKAAEKKKEKLDEKIEKAKEKKEELTPEEKKKQEKEEKDKILIKRN